MKVIIPVGTSIELLAKILNGEAELETLETFVHIDNKDESIRTKYNVTYLRRFCEETNQQIYGVPITEQGVYMCLNLRGIEEARLARLNEDALKIPILFCLQEDGTGLLVDGTHRYAYAASLGHEEILAYVLKPEQWENYLLPLLESDLVSADELQKSDSGII